MRAAVPLWDVVCETEHRLVVAVGPFHCDLEHNVVALAADDDRRRMQRLLGAVEIANKSFEPALEMQCDGLWLDAAQIVQHEGDAAVQKGELAQPVFERRKVELGLAKGLGAGQKGDLRTSGLPLAVRACRPGRGGPI